MKKIFFLIFLVLFFNLFGCTANSYTAYKLSELQYDVEELKDFILDMGVDEEKVDEYLEEFEDELKDEMGTVYLFIHEDSKTMMIYEVESPQSFDVFSYAEDSDDTSYFTNFEITFSKVELTADFEGIFEMTMVLIVCLSQMTLNYMI